MDYRSLNAALKQSSSLRAAFHNTVRSYNLVCQIWLGENFVYTQTFRLAYQRFNLAGSNRVVRSHIQQIASLKATSRAVLHGRFHLPVDCGFFCFRSKVNVPQTMAFTFLSSEARKPQSNRTGPSNRLKRRRRRRRRKEEERRKIK